MWAGDFTWWMVVGAALALAMYSFSVALGFAPAERGTDAPVYLEGEARVRRLALIGAGAVLGVLAAFSLGGAQHIPIGVLGGIGAPELGLTVAAKLRGKVRNYK